MLQFIESISRFKKGLIHLSIDSMILIIALGLALFMQNEMKTLASQGLVAAAYLSSLAAIAIGLSLWLGIPKIRITVLDSNLLVRLGLVSSGVTMVAFGLSEALSFALSMGALTIFLHDILLWNTVFSDRIPKDNPRPQTSCCDKKPSFNLRCWNNRNAVSERISNS